MQQRKVFGTASETCHPPPSFVTGSCINFSGVLQTTLGRCLLLTTSFSASITAATQISMRGLPGGDSQSKAARIAPNLLLPAG